MKGQCQENEDRCLGCLHVLRSIRYFQIDGAYRSDDNEWNLVSRCKDCCIISSNLEFNEKNGGVMSVETCSTKKQAYIWREFAYFVSGVSVFGDPICTNDCAQNES